MFDSHSHIFTANTERYSPAPLTGVLNKGALENPVSAESLLTLMDENDVERAILVQRGTVYGYDNSYIVDSAAAHPDRFSAVCCLDALAPDAVATFRHWTVARGAVGIRLMPPSLGAGIDPAKRLPETDWFASDASFRIWEAAIDQRIPICLFFLKFNRDAGLTALLRVLEKYPDARVVVDHISNLDVDQGAPDYGIDTRLKALAAYQNVTMKLSTINLNRIDAAGLDTALVVSRVVDIFGAQRTMWGSDIGQTAGNYGDMVRAARRATARLADADRRAVLYGTAAHVYSSR
jgi:predicted TIM-barrel fold metal-dependent hydrolase